MRRDAAFAAAGALLLAAGGAANAHSPVCNCYDNGDGTITCEGGFSDGSSAEGVPIRVVDARERVLVNGKMDAAGTFDEARTPRSPSTESRVERSSLPSFNRRRWRGSAKRVFDGSVSDVSCSQWVAA